MAKSYNLENLKVMVVEDNHNMRMIILQVLHALGIKEIKEAEEGASALQVLKTASIDIVITDWVMEPINGVELSHMIRTSIDSSNPYVPIIMLTGHTVAQKVEEARDAGVDEFLAKPISAKSLYTKIVSVIDNRRPFVRTKTYFGPDRRRRHAVDSYRGPERRKIVPEEKNADDEMIGG